MLSVKILNFLAKQKQQMADFTLSQANINSGTYNTAGINILANHIIQAFSCLQCSYEKINLSNIKEINEQGEEITLSLGPILRFYKRLDAPLTVLLVGHMDTVFDSHHPFQLAYLKNNIIYGPGVADMKGGIAVMLYALLAFESMYISQSSQHLGWEVILTSDEEIGSISSANFLITRAKFHKLGFVFEPTLDINGTLAGNRKGSGKFTLVMTGKSAHAGRNFSDGKNAICALANVIAKINSLNNLREGVTINVGYMHGGGAVNVVPDTSMCRLDVRVPTLQDAKWFEQCLQKIILEANNYQGFKLQLYGNFGRLPKIVAGKTEQLYKWVQQIGSELGQSITWQATGGCCDGNNLAAAGLPNIDSLGVRGNYIHSSQEYCFVDSLVERSQLLTNILWHLNISTEGFE